MKFDRIALLCYILLPALFASLPLFGKGFIPTHDGEYHIIRFKEFYSVLGVGFLFPRWAPDLNSGYGIPLFNFHYPMPNYSGAFFHSFGVSFVDSFKLSLALGYLSSVLFCFLWLSKMFSQKSAIVGTIVYSFVPYLFVDMYVRGSIGEVFAISFVLLSLACIESDNVILCALAIAGLVLSHNISTIIFSPLLIGYILLRNRKFILYAVIGIGLAAYFWIPAINEIKYVVGLNSVDYKDHFPLLFQLLIPSWGTGFSQLGYAYDELSFQIGLLAISIYAWTLIHIRRFKNELGSLAIFFLMLNILYFFLMLSVSQNVWKSLTLLQFTQYPWRLLSIVPISAAYLASYNVELLKKNSIGIGIIIGLSSILLSYSYIRPVVYTPRSDEYYLSRKEFTDGTSSLGNSFSTIWSPWKSQRPLNKAEVVDESAVLNIHKINPLKYEFEAMSTHPNHIRFNILYYPGWIALVNSKYVPIDYKSSGVIQFTIPAGRSVGEVFFTETRPRKLADIVSVLSLALLVSLYLKRPHVKRREHI